MTLLYGVLALLSLTMLSCSGNQPGEEVDDAKDTAGEPWTPDPADVTRIVRHVEMLLAPGGSFTPTEEQLLIRTLPTDEGAEGRKIEIDDLREILEVLQEGTETTGFKGFRVVSSAYAPIMLNDGTPRFLGGCIPFSMTLKPVDREGQDLDGRFFVCGLLLRDVDPIITWFSLDHDGRW